MHTLKTNTRNKGTILETVERIEKNTKVLEIWKEYNDQEDVPPAVFVVKVDVSAIPTETIQKNTHELETKLLGIGFGIFSIDYTQDYSGTMQRSKMVEYLTKEKGFIPEEKGGGELWIIPIVLEIMY